MFEAFVAQSKRKSAGRRVGGYVVAFALHAGAISAGVIFARPPAPSPKRDPVVVPVQVARISWPGLRRLPVAPSPVAPGVAEAKTAASVAAVAPRKNDRRTRRSRPAPTPRLFGSLAEPATASTPAPVAAPAALPSPGEASGVGVPASSPEAPAAAGLPAGTGTLTTAGARAPSRFLPEPLANQKKVFGEPPSFPASLARAGAVFVVHARICVAPSGEVEKVELLRRAHPTLDANVVAAVAKWRYRPLEVSGSPVPFCTLAHFEFRAT